MGGWWPKATSAGLVAIRCTICVPPAIMATRSGRQLDDYAQTYLFAPLGIQQSRWRRSPDGQATGGGGLWLTPRDTARFGTMYLQGGSWNGRRVVPADWVLQSPQRVDALDGNGYGFLWWKREFEHRGENVQCFFTSGNGGNFIFVFPALDLVVVFTGSNYDSPRGRQPFAIVSGQVLSAVQ
jgi:CubicO group peptidase (beta-lactamase class C family)